jgi:hypothetical protein
MASSLVLVIPGRRRCPARAFVERVLAEGREAYEQAKAIEVAIPTAPAPYGQEGGPTMPKGEVYFRVCSFDGDGRRSKFSNIMYWRGVKILYSELTSKYYMSSWRYHVQYYMTAVRLLPAQRYEENARWRDFDVDLIRASEQRPEHASFLLQERGMWGTEDWEWAPAAIITQTRTGTVLISSYALRQSDWQYFTSLRAAFRAELSYDPEDVWRRLMQRLKVTGILAGLAKFSAAMLAFFLAALLPILLSGAAKFFGHAPDSTIEVIAIALLFGLSYLLFEIRSRVPWFHGVIEIGVSGMLFNNALTKVSESEAWVFSAEAMAGMYLFAEGMKRIRDTLDDRNRTRRKEAYEHADARMGAARRARLAARL